MRAPLIAALLLLAALPAAAQPPVDERARDTGSPAWMTAWSPLVPIAEHPRRLERPPESRGLLVAGAPRTGLLWTAGSPVGLAYQLADARGELQAGFAGDDGGYRRPLDPNDVDVLQFAGLGWTPVGRGAAAGRVVIDREALGNVFYADVTEPHSSNPLVLADSSLSQMRRQRIQMEGAFGWRFGAWGLGLAAGFELRDHRSREARLPRISRRTRQGVTLGAARELPWAGLRLEAHVRWSGGTETLTVTPRFDAALIYQLEGYAEPTRRLVDPPSTYFRRLEHDAWAWGFAASGRALGAEWTAFWESADRDEGHFSELTGPPSKDRWCADGSVLGGSLQRPLFGERLLLTGRLRYSRLDGDATRADLEGSIFRAAEKVVWGDFEARWAPPGSPWAAAAAFTIRRESRIRRDFIERTRSEIESWTPGGVVEVARSFASGTNLAAGFGFAFYSPTVLIPDPEAMGPVYRLLTAPELALYATQARPIAVSFGVRQRVGGGAELLLRGRLESIGPHGEAPQQFAPSGDRTLWGVSLTFVLPG